MGLAQVGARFLLLGLLAGVGESLFRPSDTHTHTPRLKKTGDLLHTIINWGSAADDQCVVGRKTFFQLVEVKYREKKGEQEEEQVVGRRGRGVCR